jgi:glycosyltransferase involved in cell wall biosynthesis
MPQVRVLHCIRQGQIGGGESHLIDLVSNLNKNKYQSFVLSFTGGVMIDRLASLGISTFVINTIIPFDARVWRGVSKIIQDNNIQLIHVHGTRAFSNVIYAAKRNKLPIVYTVHGWSFNSYQGSIKRWLSILIEGYFTRIASSVINVSNSNRKIGLNHLPKLNSVVIQNGIDTSKYNPNSSYPTVRENLGVANNQILIAFIARMTRQKDPFTLIRAFSLLSDELKSKITILMVGDGELMFEVTRLTKELHIENKVIFTGFRNDISTLLNNIDIYCLPSLWEGLPLGLLEAMAMKKIVVATNVDGTIEVIENNKNGFLFPCGNHNQLCSIMQRIFVMTEKETNQIRNAAYQTIHSKFSLQGMVEKTEAVYNTIKL